MRILYICPHPNIGLNDPSGPGTHIREVVYAMQSLGHEVKIFLASGKIHNQDKHDKQDHPQGNSRLKNLAKRILGAYFFESLKDFFLLINDRSYSQQINNVIAEFKPDLIYERSYFLCLSGYRNARRHGIRYFLEMNAPATIEKPIMSSSSLFLSLAKRYEKIQIIGCDRLIVVSSALKNHFKKLVPSASHKMIVVPNAVRSDWQGHTMERQPIRASHGISLDEIVVGFVGSIFPYHGVDLLIHSFAELAGKSSSLKLMVVGDGSTLPELKSLAENLGLTSQIIFTGNVPHSDVNKYLAAMDIAVMVKSNWYGSPVKIFEYGAASLPMICPDTIPVRDVITEGEDALIVSPEKTAVVEALKRLIENQSLRKRLGDSFHTKVFSRHTWTINVRRILDIDSLP